MIRNWNFTVHKDINIQNLVPKRYFHTTNTNKVFTELYFFYYKNIRI